MTFAYAAYKKQRRQFVLGADDLESYSGGKEFKVKIYGSRFAFCVTGCSNPALAFDYYSALNDLPEVPKSPAEFVDNIWGITLEYTKQQIAKFGKDPDFEERLNATSVLIFFDSIEFSLFRIDFGFAKDIVVAGKKPGEIECLNEGEIHYFARAKQLNPVNCRVPDDFFANPKYSLENLIKKDRLTLGHESYLIGELGSFSEFKNDSLQLVTA